MTSIEGGTFSSCENLKSVSIPESVVYIGESAFKYCEKLSSLTIPQNVKYIGDEAFLGCSSLSSINIPEGVEFIGRSAFCICINLTEVTIPASVKSIGDSLFLNCAKLASATVLANVESVEHSVFGSCTDLKSVSIAERIQSVGRKFLYDCDSLYLLDAPGVPISQFSPEIRKAAARSIIRKKGKGEHVPDARWTEVLDWCRENWEEVFTDMDFLPPLTEEKFIPKQCIQWCLQKSSELGNAEVSGLLLQYAHDAHQQ